MFLLTLFPFLLFLFLEDTQEGFPQEKIEKVKQVLGVELSFWGTIDEIYSCCPPGEGNYYNCYY